MTLLILTLFAQADETQTTEIDFESVEITGKLQGPSFHLVSEVQRPKFNSLTELCFPTGFQPIVEIE